MKPRKCILVVNTRWGYCFMPTKCDSISEAVRTAKESGGFAYRIFVNGHVVKTGYCD